jgi:tetratricopeptide (TPR) repeat protein
VRLRAKALHQLERDADARQLLVRVAKSAIAGRRPATATLFDLAELFAASGEYDTAIKLLEKADSQLPEPQGARRRKQLAMDRDLAVSYASFRSEHFEVRYPASTGERYAKQIAWVLEEERSRLLHWIPPPPAGSPARAARIEVHLFAIKDFVTNFGGDIAIVGLFDGKVRVPFAELRSLHPQLVAILSHELAHALIAAATHGQAPHWIQEGLAQHIEMGTRRVNPLPDLARTGHALSFPTVDPILRGFAEEQLVDLAYNEAAWSVAFIEERYGAAAVPKLLAAFAAGKTTEQALQAVCGVTPAAFDRAFWQWGTGGQGPQIRALEVRRYDQEYAALERREQENSAPRTLLSTDVQTQGRAHVEDRRQRMADWYAAYVARTASVKRALKPVLQAYDGESVPEKGSIAGACRNLAAETGQALAAPEPWASPDPELNRSLRNAFILINDLGGACRSAQDAQVHALIDKVSLALGQAAQRLAPYGLKP